MGNIDSRACFEGGYIYVKTDRPYYYPGNVVLGKIYIRTDVPMMASHLEIKVRGKEKASFLRRETYTTGEGEDIEFHERVIKEKLHKKILEFKGNCFTF